MPAMGPTGAPIQWVLELLCSVVKSGWDAKLTIHPTLESRLIMCVLFTLPYGFVACVGTNLLC